MNTRPFETDAYDEDEDDEENSLSNDIDDIEETNNFRPSRKQ